MAISKILIIEKKGCCSPLISRITKDQGIEILTASKTDVARKIMFDSRPDLIVVDCSLSPDPLFWLKEADCSGLDAQVIAVTDQPNFDLAMRWVTGGVLNVLPKPVDGDRLKKLLISAQENSEAFQHISRRVSDETSSGLVEFYRGLCGRLDCFDLKKYIIDSCQALTGARRVELCLDDIFSGSSFNLETHVPIHTEAEENGSKMKPADNGASPLAARGYSLTYDLAANGRNLGEIHFHFDDEADLKMRRQEDLVEMIITISNALGAAATHNKAVKMAAHDPLTGLYNRRIFTEILKREFAKSQRHNYPLSLMALDLDHFKKVNDTYGHQVGDEVLKTVANTISSVSRNTDFPARLGGEEFAVILTHTSQAQAMVLAKRLRKNLAAINFEVGGSIFKQTISQGISGLEHFMVKSPEDMLYWADQSLYLAKNEGRDTIRLASDLPLTPIMKDGAYAFQ